MVNSAAPSKFSKTKAGKARRKWGRRVLLAAAALLLLALTLGPDLLLNLLLTRILPFEYGLVINYDRARAGFFFRSVTIDKISVTGGDGGQPLMSADYLGFKRVSLFNLTRLIRDSQKVGPGPLPLAGEVDIRGFSRQGPDERLTAELLEVRRLAFQPSASDLGPFVFDKLEVRGLNFDSQHAPDAPRLELSRLEARALTPDVLGGLKVNGLRMSFGTAESSRRRLDLSGLTIGGLRTGGLLRAVSGRDGLLSALWVLTACDTLDLARTVLTRGEREALNIGSAVFDFTGGRSGLATYTRRFDFTADLDALAENLRDPDWLNFRDIFGSRFEIRAEMEMEYRRDDGWANLKNLRIQSPALGRLTASARLAGLTPQRGGAAMAPADLLFYIAGGRLEALSLDFADQGLMPNFYRYLDKTAFKYSPSRQSAANIMDYYLAPLARDLEYEQGLANIPVLLSEAQAFLDRPEGFKITAEPPRPQTIMSLANLDKYDIIEKLHLTVQVNERAPVSVAVASGVFHERLPNAPRPMENLFEEEDI